MIIENIEIKNYYYHNNLSSFSDCDGVVHIKQLPYLSIVQAYTGRYSIKIGNGEEYTTDEKGFFIAPSVETQTITHHTNKETGIFAARFIFLDVLINKKYQLDDVFNFPVVTDNGISHRLNALFDELDSAEDICEFMSVTYRLVGYILKIGTEKKYIRNCDVYPLIEFIKDNYMHDISVKDMAKYLNMSESNLFSVFKKETGMSPVKYLNNYRLSIAESMLVKDEIAIKEIAEATGFCDRFYFSRMFKDKYLVSPAEYRNRNNKNN